MNQRMRDKIAGAIYGFAIGDAMGATTEFMTAEQIQNEYGQITDIVGGGWLRLKPGQVTDDTQMTVCVMDALMTNMSGDIYRIIERCKRNFIKWVNSNPADIGAQCARAILCMMNGGTVKTDENALGNGSLMRAMPMAILDLQFLNVIQGRLTHNNQFCSNIILEYSRLIQDYLNDRMVYNYTDKVKGLLEPSGYIVNTFNNAVYWSMQDSFEEAIIGAVNHGGDADTIAAIAGSLAGAKFGYKAIPQRWINKLDKNVVRYLEKFQNFVFYCLQI